EGFKTLNEGDTVEFDMGQGQKGPAAENVVQVS
ncbi:MAG: cold-shock protein, partial [Planctomycetota bacterium]